MATTTKKKSYTTPKGELLFTNIVNVDYGTEQYPCHEGRFRTTLCMSPEEAQKLIDKLGTEIDKAKEFAEGKFEDLKPATKKKLGAMRFNLPGDEEYDRDGNATGRIKFNFRTGAFYENRNGEKMQRKIAVFDTMAQPVHLKNDPGNGTVAKISFTCSPYFVEGTGVGGLTLWLNAVQILKLVEQGERTAESYGFEAEEDEADEVFGSETSEVPTSGTGTADADF